MISEFDHTNITGFAMLTKSQCEFIENEPADSLKTNAVYILQPQIPVPKIMHINGKEITSYRFTAVEVVDGKFQRCVKIKATSFTKKGRFNGVPFDNRDFVSMNVYNQQSSTLRIVSPIAIEYLGQGTYFDNWSKREQYCEAFKLHPDEEGYCQKFSLADLCRK